MSGSSLTETIFGSAGGDPTGDYNPWVSDPGPTGGNPSSGNTSGGTTPGATSTLSTLDPSTGRVNPNSVLQFDDFNGFRLAQGTPAALLTKFQSLITEDANETQGITGSYSVIPALTLPDGSTLYFTSTGQLQGFFAAKRQHDLGTLLKWLYEYCTAAECIIRESIRTRRR